MQPNLNAIPGLSDFLRALKERPRRWLGPAAVLTMLAVVFAVVQQPTWEVSQGLILRNEAAHNQSGLGKFSHADDMKTTQETILEVLKSAGVLRTALEKVGPPANYSLDPAQWPTEEDLADLRDALKLMPPKGAEFGKTEIFYLKVKTKDRERGVALVTALCDELRTQFQNLREVKADSMIDELTKTVALAQADLRKATGILSEMERQAGTDLAELRNLSENSATDSVLRRKAIEMENELRQAQTAMKTQEELLQVVRESQRQEGRLLASPAQLLETQPNLRRLMDAHTDAALRAATLANSLTEFHPTLRAARAAETESRERLNEELEMVARGIEVNRQLAADRVEMLTTQLTDVRQRLMNLAALRAEYANAVADMRHRTALLERAQTDLADARASRAGAATASLINRLDQPDTGTKPVSPGALLIVAAGMAGGLFAGLALVFLTMPVSSNRHADNSEIPASELIPAIPNERRLRPRDPLPLKV